jgi:hypothetical protein
MAVTPESSWAKRQKRGFIVLILIQRNLIKP